jgi:homoserine dehydrogenase
MSAGRRRWRLCLAGVGYVGGGVLAMLHERAADLPADLQADLVVTGVVQSGGAAVDPDGLDLGVVLSALRAGESLSAIPGVGHPGMTPAETLDASAPDILLEATPVNLRDGEPGLSTVRRALRAGVHVVLANKAPLALAYEELTALRDPAMLRFSATVAGALPVINIGRRDLAGCRINRLEGVFNGTSQSILRAMERGLPFAEALADAQRRGIAEADPSLDVDGHDAACKLIITVNAVLGRTFTLADVEIEGIGSLSAEDVRRPLAEDKRLVPLCLAERDGDDVHLSVRPTPLPLDHPLARLHADEMGVVFHTEGVDRLSASSLEPGPEPSSAAMLRDVIDIIRTQTCVRL